MEYGNILSEIGLNKWESRTYLALLELGSTTTGPLVKKCEVPQSKIYSVLESLNNKGLVSYIIKGKIKYFQASEPEKIISILKEKEIKVNEAMPKLKQLFIVSRNKQKVEIYEGMKAITSLLIDLIENSKQHEDYLSFSIGDDQFSDELKIFWNKIGAYRSENKLNVKLLDNIKYKQKLKDFYSDRWKYLKDIMRFSEEIFPSTTIIFQNKIIILNFMSEPKTAVVIDSKDLTKYYKEFYMSKWKLAKK